MNAPKMTCAVYKGQKRADTYLYLPAGDAFDRVPGALLKQLGELVHVMDLELTPERKLARADPTAVMKNLAEFGYYLQLPPSLDDPTRLR